MSLRRLLFAAWVAACVAAALFPIFVLVMVSLAPGAALFGERPALIVTAPTFRFWRAVLTGGDLWAPLAKSLTVAVLTTIGALAVAAPGAYAIAKLPAAARRGVVVGLLVTRMFPELTIGVSVATRFAQLGLTDTYWGLALAHLTGVLPFIAWILVGAFEAIPSDVEAAASIDGASRLATLRRVVLPMTAPATGGRRAVRVALLVERVPLRAAPDDLPEHAAAAGLPGDRSRDPSADGGGGRRPGAADPGDRRRAPAASAPGRAGRGDPRMRRRR